MIHSIRQFAAGFTGAAGDLRTRRAMRSYDQALLWVGLLLLGFGLVMVYSASIALPAAPKYAAYQGHHFLVRHLAALMMGFAPVIGKGVNGSHRRISLGIAHIQPSELMKLAATLYAADYTVRKQAVMHSVREGFLPMALAIGCAGALLLLEPDMGAFMVIAVIAMGVLFLGGINLKWFSGLALTVAATFGLLSGSRRGGARAFLRILTRGTRATRKARRIKLRIRCLPSGAANGSASVWVIAWKN